MIRLSWRIESNRHKPLLRLRRTHRLGRIGNQIDQDLLHLEAYGFEARDLRLMDDLHLGPVALQIMIHQRESISDQSLQIDRLALFGR
ncbi:hypothetical protein D3C71_1903880 [compost metagenome]